ncbi:hypothetical protein Hamer_G030750 [Homarus americanus]|uniref:Uncharacterized protein n=1 Tax=Homarus americanus TaxID=6706 RepID=A0A8J5N228_HOMAM|nr:hypothetical protein Hamer_G030750 [Homarus americanus]
MLPRPSPSLPSSGPHQHLHRGPCLLSYRPDPQVLHHLPQVTFLEITET